MGDDFSKYEMMKDAGSPPKDVYRAAIEDGVDPIGRIRLIRAVFSLTPRRAKEVALRAEGIAEFVEEQLNNSADALDETRDGREQSQ